jgi:nitric oxide reductase NorD protein
LSQSSQIEQALAELRALSSSAAQSAEAALAEIRRHGDAVATTWLQAARKLYAHERDSGQAFIDGSRAAESAAEEVLPWTRQALSFTRWAGSGRALEAFMH